MCSWCICSESELCESAVTLPRMVQPGFGCFYRWRLNHFPGQPGPVLSHIPYSEKVGLDLQIVSEVSVYACCLFSHHRTPLKKASLCLFLRCTVCCWPQPHFTPLITTLWAWTFSESWAQSTVCSSSLFISFHTKILWDTMSKRSPDRLAMPTALPSNCQHIQFIGESYQADQVWFPLCEFILTTPNSLLVLHVSESISSINCSITLLSTEVRLNSL